ncbi:protein SCO1/2 [Arboricoccus pini]|uniref:Protein SCO1/2 n=1 Tax=Arboricoccus pini TaxID=1963835 RepID=A0A212R749_9PROT|nr:SCO family protein [Arboricoccus pini]SNB67843.1 protein SCO1/2 [Arboricoccus pini]
MRSRLFLAGLISLAVVSAALATVIVQRADKQANVVTGQALIGGPFTLTADDGRRVTERDFADRYKLVYFGYTYCPDICPLGLQTISQALDDLPPAEAANIVPLFITVDPGRDTPSVMRDYVRAFHPSLIGLTGSQQDIDAVTRAYRVYVHKGTPDKDGNYSVDHSGFTYLMSPSGEYLAHFGHDVSAEQMARSLQQLIPSS